MRIPRTMAMVLAGGKGSRLEALTEHRVKPALPVAGTYRLIDISMSNLMHSHLSDKLIKETLSMVVTMRVPFQTANFAE